MSEPTQDQLIIEELTQFIVAAADGARYLNREDAVGVARFKVAHDRMIAARERAIALGYLWPLLKEPSEK